jgi:phosphatidylglycerophosphate synthase
MGALRNYVPNALSLSRIPIGVIVVLTYTPSNPTSYWFCITALALALITDIFDGRLARAWNVSTDVGYFLDGLCDKVVYSALLVVIARDHKAQVLLPWLLILREILIYAIRSLDEAPIHIQRQLRPMSMTYAFLVRCYFLGFLLWSWTRAHDIQVELMEHFFFFGYAAALCGYLHLYVTVRLMYEKSRRRHGDRNETHDLQRNLRG